MWRPADFVPEVAMNPGIAGMGKQPQSADDGSKPLVVRGTPAYQRGVAGLNIEAPARIAWDRTYYNA
jgi:hypothetical protein